MGIYRDAWEMTFKPMPILTGLSLVSLVILVLLGNWQYARYSEKIDRPVEIAQDEAPELIEVEIALAHTQNVQQVYGFADGEPIWRRYAPGMIRASNEPVIVMVDATGGPEPIPTEIAGLPETVRFEGVITAKTAADGIFDARDEPENDLWYRLNPEGMTDAFGLQEVPRLVEPVIMTVRNSANMDQSRLTPNPYAFSKPLDPLPPERHFGYALTWWGMALGLIGVYLALHRARGRLKF